MGLLVDIEQNGFSTDPNAGQSELFYAYPGVLVRLTRNLDKERGFVNGATGYVRTILSCQGERPIVFTVQLCASDVFVLVHPIWHDGQLVLPCTYGYACTIRRAQGATYVHGCIYFDHCYPAELGYGYVAASRFKTKNGIYLYGKVRRTDWIPVHRPADAGAFQLRRSELSDGDYSSDEEADGYYAEDDRDIYWRQYSLKGKLYRDPHRLVDEDGEESDGYGSDDSDSINSDESEDRERARLAIKRSRAELLRSLWQ